MHDETFDRAVRAGVGGVPRRRFMGLVAGLTGAALARPTADAGRKRRKKCKKGTKKCGKQCLNLSTDSANCGACGNACSGGQTCSGGVCTCPADQSFINGSCIPRFGCTPELDTCAVGKRACPIFTGESDANCQTDSTGQPFCATSRSCVTIDPNDVCPVGDGQPRIFIPCSNLCPQPGETGACVRPISQARA